MLKYKAVMLVDDSFVDLFIAERLLIREAEVETLYKFSMGHEAIDVLKNLRGRLFPELIILDVKMPLMDGYNFLKELVMIKDFDPTKCKVLPISAYLDCYKKLDVHNLTSDFHFIDQCYMKPLNTDMLHALNWYEDKKKSLFAANRARAKRCLNIYKLANNRSWQLAAGNKKIDVSHLAKGMYFVQVGEVVRKLVIE